MGAVSPSCVRAITALSIVGLACGSAPQAAPAPEPVAAVAAELACTRGDIEPCDCVAGKGYRPCVAGAFADCVCRRDNDPPQEDREVRPPRAEDLAGYLRDLSGDGPLMAAIDTNRGTIRCELFADRTPITVANFVGLARGLKAWADPDTGDPTNAPFYDGSSFHRVVKDFVIQGGDPTGTGRGGPGYHFGTEIADGLLHDRVGRLAMARGATADSNGGQFYIALKELRHLDGSYTVFGQCGDHGVLRRIAALPVEAGGRPTTPVVIRTVKIYRD